MADEKRILEMQFDVDELLKQGAETTKVLKELKEAQKELKKANKEGTVEYQKLDKEIREHTKDLRQNKKTIDNVEKATQAAEGSNDQLKAKIAELRLEYNALSKEQRENQEVGQELKKTIAELTEELKENEAAVGDTRRNVGNYGQDLGGAIQQTLAFKDAIIVMGRAFLTNPIFLAIAALVGALKLLFEAFTRTEEGQAKVNRITAILSGAWNGLLKAIEPVAEFLGNRVTEAFDNPREAMEELWEAIKGFGDFLKNEFLRLIETTGVVFDELVNGNFKAAGEAALEALDAFTNLVPATLLLKQTGKLLADNYDDIAKSISDTVDQAQRLVDAELALAKAQREQEATQLRFQIQAERLRQVRDDDLKSIDDRIKANQELGQVLSNQIEQERSLAMAAIRVAQLRIAVEGKSKDNLDALAEANLKLLEIQERVEAQTSEQRTNANSLLREKQELIDEEIKLETEKNKLFADLQDKLHEQRLSDDEKEILSAQKKFDDLFQQLVDSGVKEEEFRQTEKELIRQQEEEISQILATQRERRLKEAEEVAQKEMQIEEAKRNTVLTGLSSTTRDIQKIASQNTSIYRAAATTDTLINTYAGARAAYKSLAGTGPQGPLLGTLAAAAAVTAGLLDVQRIQSAKRGAIIDQGDGYTMFDVGGKLHSSGGTKYRGEDGNVFEVERDEIITVLNRNSSAMLKGLSNLNVAGGGVSFFGRRGGVAPTFNDGGIASRFLAQPVNNQVQTADQILTLAESLPNPVVQVEDIRSGVGQVVGVEELAQA